MIDAATEQFAAVIGHDNRKRVQGDNRSCICQRLERVSTRRNLPTIAATTLGRESSNTNGREYTISRLAIIISVDYRGNMKPFCRASSQNHCRGAATTMEDDTLSIIPSVQL
jgi:hypothetical protein